MKQLNLRIDPDTDIYTILVDGQEVEVVIMKDLGRNSVLIEALEGQPFDRSTAWGGAFMSCQTSCRADALRFSRKWKEQPK